MPTCRTVLCSANYKDPSPGWPRDTLGAAVNLLGVNPRVTERINSTLGKSGGGQASRPEIGYD